VIAPVVQVAPRGELPTGFGEKFDERKTPKKSCIQNITSMDMKCPNSEGRRLELGSKRFLQPRIKIFEKLGPVPSSVSAKTRRSSKLFESFALLIEFS
jgi:hypothetical protein